MKRPVLLLLFAVFTGFGCQSPQSENNNSGKEVRIAEPVAIAPILPVNVFGSNLQSILNSKSQVTITDKARLPETIKNYYAAQWEDGYKIANPGEEWDAGCDRGTAPSRKLCFTLADTLAGKYFVIYEQGGIGTIYYVNLFLLSIDGRIMETYAAGGNGNILESKESLINAIAGNRLNVKNGYEIADRLQ